MFIQPPVLWRCLHRIKGLLLGRTELQKGEILDRLKKADTAYVSKVIPADEIVQTDIRGFVRYFEQNVDVEGKRFAVRCKRRGNQQFSSMDIEKLKFIPRFFFIFICINIFNQIKERTNFNKTANTNVKNRFRWVFWINTIRVF